MLIYLTTLNLTKFLTKKIPKLSDNEFDYTIVVVVDACNHDNLMCKNYIFNKLKNIVYDMYSSIKRAKGLQEDLEKKYKTKDASMKKFKVNKFLVCKMVNLRTLKEKNECCNKFRSTSELVKEDNSDCQLYIQ